MNAKTYDELFGRGRVDEDELMDVHVMSRGRHRKCGSSRRAVVPVAATALVAICMFATVALTAPLASGAATDPQVVGTDTTTSSTSITQRGHTVQWTLNNLNAGASTADITVTDPIPAGQTYVEGSLAMPPGWTGSVSGGVVHASGSVDSTTQTSAEVPVPAPSFNTSVTDGGGDGYAPIPYGDNVYVIHHHHDQVDVVNCVDKVTRVECPGFPKSIPGADALHEWRTGTILDTYLDPSGRLYFPGAMTNTVQGTVVSPGIFCLQLPSADPCATGLFTTVANGDRIANGLVKIGSKVWTLATGDSATVLGCVDLAADGSMSTCSSSVPTGFAGDEFAELIAVGGQPFGTATAWSGQPGLWPWASQHDVRANGSTSHLFSRASTPVRWLDASGIAKGFCYHQYGNDVDVCLDDTGNLTAAPAALTTLTTGYPGVGEDYTFGYSPLVVGSKVYLPVWNLASQEVDGILDSIVCFDWATNAACSDFGNTNEPGVMDTSSINGGHQHTYGIAVDDQNPRCGWAYGDAHQLFNLQLVKGADCGGGQTGATVSLDAASYYCGVAPEGHRWDEVRLAGVPAADLANTAVTVTNNDGTVVPGFDGVPLAADGTLDLSAIMTTGATSKLTVRVDLSTRSGAPYENGAQPTVTLSFAGPAGTVCFQATNDESCQVITSADGVTNTAHVDVDSSAVTASFDPSAHLAIDPADPTSAACAPPSSSPPTVEPTGDPPPTIDAAGESAEHLAHTGAGLDVPTGFALLLMTTGIGVVLGVRRGDRGF